jgi:hypothetical protein
MLPVVFLTSGWFVRLYRYSDLLTSRSVSVTAFLTEIKQLAKAVLVDRVCASEGVD